MNTKMAQACSVGPNDSLSFEASKLSFDERVARLEAIAKTLRIDVVDMMYTAQSGHIGGSLSATDFVAALYFDLMNIDPARPHWPERDRFVLSKGHACPIWYVALARRGPSECS